MTDSDSKAPTTHRSGPAAHQPMRAAEPSAAPKLGAAFDAHVELVSAELEVLHGGQGTHGKRLTGLEGRVGIIEQRPVEPRPTRVVEQIATIPHRDAALERQKSDAALEHEATMGAVIRHNEQLEGAVADVATALAIVATELGVAHKLPASVSKSLPPPGRPRKRPTIASLARENRAGLAASVGAAVILALELALRVLEVLAKHQ